MRLFLVILTALFAISSGEILTDNNFLLPSTVDVLPHDCVIIMNSAPKMGRYTDPEGNEFGYGITRTTLINVSKNPLRLTVNFQPDPFAFVTFPGLNVKVFLPPDTVSFDDMPFNKLSWSVDDGLKPFLNAGLNTATSLQDTINANQERVFYIGALYLNAKGIPKAELVLKGHNLFFRPSMLDSLSIPCGKIVFK